MGKMKKQVFKKSALATAISSALLMSIAPAGAYAEEVAADNERKYETVEVTATRRSQNIMDVPFNISAVAGEDLADGNIVDAAEMLRNVAGITVVDRGYRNSGAVNGVIIRGVNVDSGANGDVALSAVPTVSTYINDTPLFANFILKDVQQAEVLRGPQGTLYGSGSLAGTVRYRMNKPDLNERYGSASIVNSLTEGSEGFNTNADVLINAPLTDRIGFRANAGIIKNAGITDYTNIYKQDANGAPVIADGGDVATGSSEYTSVEDADTVDITYARMSALFDVNDDISVLFSIQNQKDEVGGRRQVTRGSNSINGSSETYGDYENGAVLLEPSEREVSLMALEAEWDMGFATLTSSTSKYSNEGSSTSDNTGFYAQMDWFNDLYYGSPRPMAMANRGYSEEAVVQEFRLVSNGEGNVDWTAGAYFMDQDRLSMQDSYMPGYQEWLNAAEPAGVSQQHMVDVWLMGDTDQDFDYDRVENFKDTAFFGELTYHMSDRLRATVGARSFDNTFKNNTDLILPIWAAAGFEAHPSFTTKDSGMLRKANISYDLTDDTMLYSTVSEGYRRGGANAVPLVGKLGERPEWQQYESDRSVNSEIGLKGFIGNGHSYTLSAFNMDWENPQLNTATPVGGFFAVTNGDSARTRGIELELQGYLSEKLHYVLGFAHISAELSNDFYKPTAPTTKVDNPDGPGQITVANPVLESLQAASGTKLPSTPENTLSVALDYAQTLGNGIHFTAQVNGYYQSNSLNYLGESASRQADIEGFSLWNVSSKVSYQNFDVSVFVKNVFNDDGVTGLITEGHMGTDPSENFLGNSSKDYISQPRTIGLNAGFKF